MIPDWDLSEVVNSKHLYLVAFYRRSITTTKCVCRLVLRWSGIQVNLVLIFNIVGNDP